MDEVQDAIDTSIGEIPKPKPVSMGAYSTVGRYRWLYNFKKL
jgi:hypothetical protein